MGYNGKRRNMFLFAYYHMWGYVSPDDDEVHRIMVFCGKKNNVLVWRGYHNDLTLYTINEDAIWEIEGLIEEQGELTDAEKTDKEYIPALDVPEDTYAFFDNEVRYREFSDMMLTSEKGKDAGIDSIISMIFKIQDILRKNGVDVTIISKRDLQ